MKPTQGRISVVQPALPTYRRDFFKRLSNHYGDRFRVYYSQVDLAGLTSKVTSDSWEQPIGQMRNPIRGVEWQSGALSIPVERGDLVVVCGAPRAITTLALLAKCRLKGANTIWWGHYWSASSKGWRLRLRMQLAKLADNLLFYTDREVDWFRKDAWQFDGLVSALNNGLSLEKMIAHRAPYDAKTRGADLLFIGRLTQKAELGVLLEAMPLLSEQNSRLHIIGSGDREGALREQAARLGFHEKVVWHGTVTDESVIAGIANDCALFVYPGQVGLSLIHAMAYGLPSIVHDDELRHMPEIAAFDTGITGEVFVRGSAQSLAATIDAVMQQSADRERYATASTAIVEEQFTTENMAHRFIAFAEQIDARAAAGA